MHIYFDFDDTLIQTQAAYEANKKHLAEQVCTFFSECLTVADVLTYFEKRDIENISSHGFSKERYPRSWRDTVVYFSLLYPEHYDAAFEKVIEDEAKAIFTTNIALYDDVVPTLEYLQKNAYVKTLNLITLGDTFVQCGRLVQSGLLSYFDNVHVVAKKTREVYTSLSTQYGDEHMVMIGNSLKSDILPAVEAGCGGILINRPSWSYDSQVNTHDRNSYLTIESLSELLTIIPK